MARSRKRPKRRAPSRRKKRLNQGFIRPSSSTPSDPGFVYHATNEENLVEIRTNGVVVHSPWHGTDQDEWPDGSREKRSYWSDRASVVWSFAPEHGDPVILRTKRTSQFKKESTGDIYATKKVPAKLVEVLTGDGWIPIKQAHEDQEENPTLALWRLDPVIGTWKRERDVTEETAEHWLAIFQKDDPQGQYVVAAKRPRTAAEKQLAKQGRERRKKRVNPCCASCAKGLSCDDALARRLARGET